MRNASLMSARLLNFWWWLPFDIQTIPTYNQIKTTDFNFYFHASSFENISHKFLKLGFMAPSAHNQISCMLKAICLHWRNIAIIQSFNKIRYDYILSLD